MSLFQAQRIHCIGIGGIGVSALAQLWHAQGKVVSGSDAAEAGHRMENVRDVDLVVYSDAVPEDNVERVEARQRGIPELSYAQALGEVSRQCRTIVVTGTHGKSTTTALLGLMLEAAGLDPLVIVGSKVPGWKYGNLRLPNSRFQIPDSRFLVVEGDDYRDHFLELMPYAMVITNIEYDHPDYFRDLAHTVESFRKLAERVPADGMVVINEDDPGCQQLMNRITPQGERVYYARSCIIDPAVSHSPSHATGIVYTYGRSSEVFEALDLQVPGEFNRYNATAAATCAMELGVPRDVVEKVAREFNGVWRRFEIVGTISNSQYPIAHSPIIISDYAHHPTAIRATMKAAREAYPGRRLVLVYQPHQHSRTKHLFNDFVEVLKDAADLVIVSAIYAVKGRMEERDVSGRDIVEALSSKPLALSRILYGGDLKETKRMVLEQVQPGDVVIFMGAGDIDNLARELCSKS